MESAAQARPMTMQSPPTEQVTTTIGAIYQWANTPTTVVLIFALAGAFFLGIYMIRRLRGKNPNRKV
jgi:hypothetical protein